ncbi:MAG: Endoglucanase [Hydrocarboniphaga sp.]|uniref:cellulose synthase complex periplasmic endoglucanase BcsZ n=1 Tax=Hydrocarboniphaga sp. TaxID=2033016 RepID=UPI002602A4CF|nr:cellulose synthase complex periplasmic endoglucanase BcsZ [Hydrocarboniphaga sp.]MDB5970706.1 Endoglucanase [Hydrocarboniphaga sp.]
MKAVLVSLTLVLLAAAAGFGWLWQRAYGPWSQWQVYAEHFVQPDGRVVDITADSRSTSEGQAYSLFFALVANDRPRFDRILKWTRDNLCAGDFAVQLPSWLWGRKADGSWGVLDANAATDADLWLAYTLLQASRVWNDAALGQSGRVLLWQIKAQEIADMGVSGKLMLPAPQGFALEGQRWKLNPSYYPRFQFAGLATEDRSGPWNEIWQNYERLLPKIAARGLVPDWFLLDAMGQVQPDPGAPNVGSYDSIRSYLWAGLSTAADPEGIRHYAGFVDVIKRNGVPPSRIDVASAAVTSTNAPVGFSAAVLPWLKDLGEDVAVEHQQRELQNHRVDGLLGRPAHYYDQVLALFGEGWISRRYRFEADGRVTLRWESLWFGL